MSEETVQASDAIHLEAISLQNFRQLRQVTLTLDPQLTALVAPNGGGKTALLDAIATGLSVLIASLTGATATGFQKTDIRLARSPQAQMVEQLPLQLRMQGVMGGEVVQWQRQLSALNGKTTSQAAELQQHAQRLSSALQAYADRTSSQPPSLPIIAYYGTGRLWDHGRLSKHKSASATRFNRQLDAYVDCLNPRSSYVSFKAWFEAIVREAQNERHAGVSSPAQPQRQLDAVRGATDIALASTGWRQLDWDFLAEEVVVTHPLRGRLAVSSLSDGIRSVIALVADIAHRCARLNPHLGADAARDTPGIVLIDEVDMHLHPAWQQVIVDALREAFPRVQLIISTHSPQVLSTINAQSIRMLDPDAEGDDVVSTPEQQTRGVERADVMACVI